MARMGRPFTPDYVAIVPELPKSRSFKILRRVVRDLANGKSPDVTAVENPHSLAHIVAVRDEAEPQLELNNANQ